MRFPMIIGLAFAMGSLLAGCGQKGVLYREQPEPAPATSHKSPDQAREVTGKTGQEAPPESR